MKKTLIVVLAFVLLWLFFKKSKTTKSITEQGNEPGAENSPINTGGAVTRNLTAIDTAQAQASPINAETTYTPPKEIEAALMAKTAAIWSNPNIEEAQAKEAELARVEAERQAAGLALRELNEKIYKAQQEKQVIDAATLKAAQDAKAAADAANKAKIEDLAYKSANSIPTIQYDAASSPELDRLNAFMAVKAKVASDAMYQMQRQTLDNMIYTIERQYRLAYQARINGEYYPGQIEAYTRVAQSWETILKTQMATIEQEYVFNAAKEVASVSGFDSILVPHPVTGDPVQVSKTPLIM